MNVSSFLIGYQAGKNSGGGGSSGGGTLPAGVYWEQFKPYAPKAVTNYFFKYNGKLHLLSRQSSSSDLYDIYEYSNGVYSIIASNLNILYGASGVREYNGKIHFLAGGYEYHYVFDGGTLTRLNNLPTSATKNEVFEWNGILYVHSYGTSAVLYQWNESEDTWTDSGIVQSEFYANGYRFVYNDELYRLDSKKLYKYVDGSAVLIKTFDFSTSLNMLIGDNLYSTTSSVGIVPIYKYNIATDTLTDLGLTPYFGSGGYLYYYDGTVRLAGGNSTWRNNLILHEIAE